MSNSVQSVETNINQTVAPGIVLPKEFRHVTKEDIVPGQEIVLIYNLDIAPRPLTADYISKLGINCFIHSEKNSKISYAKFPPARLLLGEVTDNPDFEPDCFVSRDVFLRREESRFLYLVRV